MAELKTELKKPIASRFLAESYPVVMRLTYGHIRAVNYDFGIEFSADAKLFHGNERFVQMAILIDRVYAEIEDRLKALDRSHKAHPTPLPTESVLSQRAKDEIKFNDAVRLLGVSAQTLRRMADSGEIPCHKTRKGHRRFLRSQLTIFLEKEV